MSLQTHLPDCHGRTVLSATAETIESVVAELRDFNDHFILVLFADATNQSAAELLSSAHALIRRGASYVCCWGPDCERLHDCFDEAANMRRGHDSDHLNLITTWHDDEPINEVLWFALNATVPAPGYADSTKSVIAVSVAGPEWAQDIRDYLNAGAPLLDEA